MLTNTVTVNYSGWILFAPFYHEGYPDDGLEPIPVPGFGWLLELALLAYDLINWAVYLIDPDFCGFIAKVKPLKKPKTVSYKTLAWGPF